MKRFNTQGHGMAHRVQGRVPQVEPLFAAEIRANLLGEVGDQGSVFDPKST